MKKFDRAIQILVAGFCINLCMGILYAWSVFKKALVVDLGWSNADASLPYTVAIITFALSLLVAADSSRSHGPTPRTYSGYCNGWFRHDRIKLCNHTNDVSAYVWCYDR